MVEIDAIELAGRLASIEGQIVALRADLARYFSELEDHESRLRRIEGEIPRIVTGIDALGNRVNTWSVTNSLAALIAAIIGWLK